MYAHCFCFAVLCCGYSLTDFPYPPGLLRWHCGNLTIAPVPAKQPWWIWINTSCEIIMNDYITTTKQSTTKPCAYLLGYTVNSSLWWSLTTSKHGWLQSLIVASYDHTLFSNVIFFLEKYLFQETLVSRKNLTRLRMSFHKLAVESGRFNKTPFENRLCVMCDKGLVEDEIQAGSIKTLLKTDYVSCVIRG